MIRLLAALALAAAPTKTTYYADGGKWSERIYGDGDAGVLDLTWSIDGSLEKRVTIDSRGYAHGAFVAYGRDGGVIKEGTYEHGIEVGHWVERDDKGRLVSQRDLDAGRVVASVEWWEGHKVRELTAAGVFFEWNARGVLTRRRSASGLDERWQDDGGRHTREQHTAGALLLLDAWDEQGRHVVKNGNGTLIVLDGELAFPWHVVYRGGVEVSRKAK